MTDRYFAITVLLKSDIREDDAEPILTAIQMIKGVQAAEAHISDRAVWAAEKRIRRELTNRLWNALNEEHKTR